MFAFLDPYRERSAVGRLLSLVWERLCVSPAWGRRRALAVAQISERLFCRISIVPGA